MQPIIQLKHVSYRYPNIDKVVLKEINLEFAKGDFIAVLGPNGSGKSTLAKILNALLFPDKGIVIVDQVEVSEEMEVIWSIRQQVGMVFQNPDNQIIASTVEDDVAFGLENQGLPHSLMKQRVEESLVKVGLLLYKDQEPHYLSGGQKQKVAIAGIIAMKPKVIVLDEATSMLDPQGRDEVLKTVQRLNKEEQMTIIHITHELQEALKANRIIVLHEGKILLDGSPKEVLTKRELLKKIGLDVPLAVELAARLREKGYSFSEDVVYDEEFIQELWTLL